MGRRKLSLPRRCVGVNFMNVPRPMSPTASTMASATGTSTRPPSTTTSPRNTAEPAAATANTGVQQVLPSPTADAVATAAATIQARDTGASMESTANECKALVTALIVAASVPPVQQQQQSVVTKQPPEAPVSGPTDATHGSASTTQEQQQHEAKQDDQDQQKQQQRESAAEPQQTAEEKTLTPGPPPAEPESAPSDPALATAPSVTAPHTQTQQYGLTLPPPAATAEAEPEAVAAPSPSAEVPRREPASATPSSVPHAQSLLDPTQLSNARDRSARPEPMVLSPDAVKADSLAVPAPAPSPEASLPSRVPQFKPQKEQQHNSSSWSSEKTAQSVAINANSNVEPALAPSPTVSLPASSRLPQSKPLEHQQTLVQQQQQQVPRPVPSDPMTASANASATATNSQAPETTETPLHERMITVSVAELERWQHDVVARTEAHFANEQLKRIAEFGCAHAKLLADAKEYVYNIETQLTAQFNDERIAMRAQAEAYVAQVQSENARLSATIAELQHELALLRVTQRRRNRVVVADDDDEEENEANPTDRNTKEPVKQQKTTTVQVTRRDAPPSIIVHSNGNVDADDVEEVTSDSNDSRSPELETIALKRKSVLLQAPTELEAKRLKSTFSDNQIDHDDTNRHSTDGKVPQPIEITMIDIASSPVRADP